MQRHRSVIPERPPIIVRLKEYTYETPSRIRYDGW